MIVLFCGLKKEFDVDKVINVNRNSEMKHNIEENIEPQMYAVLQK